MYQDGLSDYSDFSPMAVPSYEDKGSYEDTDLILMNQIETLVFRPDGLSDYSDFSPMAVPSYEDKGSYKDTDLSDYSDFSPMAVPSYEDKGSHEDTDLILMNQIETLVFTDQMI